METDKIFVLKKRMYKWDYTNDIQSDDEYFYFHTLENLLEYVKVKSYKNVIIHEYYSESSDGKDPEWGKWHIDFYWEKDPVEFED